MSDCVSDEVSCLFSLVNHVTGKRAFLLSVKTSKGGRMDTGVAVATAQRDLGLACMSPTSTQNRGPLVMWILLVRHCLLIVRGYRDSAARDPYFPETVLIYGCYMVAFSADEQEEYTYLLYLCDLTLGCLICLTNIGTGHQLIQRKAKAQCFTPLLPTGIR